MTLSEWMASTKTKPAELAQAVGVHWATIYKWKAGQAFPRRRQAEAIFRATKGAVTATDLLPGSAAP